MRKLLLAPLLLLLPGQAFAGPPAGVSGQMALERDAIADGLTACAKQKDAERRIALLERLAKSHDPRVAVALGALVEGPADDIGERASCALLWHYSDVELSPYRVRECPQEMARKWWAKHGEDLCRQARRPMR
jgi:hypothetical protein